MSSGGCRPCGSRRSAMGRGRRSFPSRTCCAFAWGGRSEPGPGVETPVCTYETHPPTAWVPGGLGRRVLDRGIAVRYSGEWSRRRRVVDHVDRFGVSMDPELLTAFDQLTRRRGYKSRSEAIRDIVRNALVEEEWREGDQPVIGTVTLVYDHDS